jgi:hypothetical protein
VAAGASSVRRVDRHVETAVTDHLLGATESPTVAEFGPEHHCEESSDAVLRIDERSTRRLASAEMLQCVLQGQRFCVGGVDHLVADVDPLATG